MITTLINKIRTAVRGIDVRNSIADAFEYIYCLNGCCKRDTEMVGVAQGNTVTLNFADTSALNSNDKLFKFNDDSIVLMPGFYAIELTGTVTSPISAAMARICVDDEIVHSVTTSSTSFNGKTVIHIPSEGVLMLKLYAPMANFTASLNVFIQKVGE